MSYIGLAHRAGKTLSGTTACEAGIKRRKLNLLLIQEEMSQSSRKRFINLCEKNNVDVLILSGYDGLGSAIGREGIMVLGITDKGFAKKIKSIFSSEDPEI